MKRIYFTVLVTALISLFLLGQFIDMVFEAQSESVETKEFIAERQLVNGLSKHLSQISDEGLQQEVEKLESQFEIKLSLERKSDLSLSSEISNLLDSQGLVTDSDSGIQLNRGISNHSDWLLVYQVENKDIHDKADISVLEFWLTVLFYVSFCLALVIWAVPLAKRLSTLNRFAHDFGKGDLSKRVALSRFSYVEELEVSFNRMAGQIEELVAENKLLAGSISHDLRTPLSCLRFGVDSALEIEQLEKKNEYLQRMDQDLCRMEAMLEAFLDYASLERQSFTLAKTQTDIGKLLQSTVKDCQPLADKEQKQIELKYTQGNLLDVDPNWVGRAFSNLITNAISHCRHMVKVSCLIRGREIQIKVEDDGPGIPAGDSANIFKAFFKLDKSRGKDNGYGLGLAIVARVVNWHHGKIDVTQSDALSGACFTITLPLSKS